MHGAREMYVPSRRLWNRQFQGDFEEAMEGWKVLGLEPLRLALAPQGAVKSGE
jgi:hypothetical protein